MSSIRFALLKKPFEKNVGEAARKALAASCWTAGHAVDSTSGHRTSEPRFIPFSRIGSKAWTRYPTSGRRAR
jgi:hypothetical protein